jgi:hypothetical protein
MSAPAVSGRAAVRTQLSPSAADQTLPCSDSLNQFANSLARFEKGNPLGWHVDPGSSFWISSDARSPLARVESSESADFNLVPGSQRTDDAIKYGANDNIGFLSGQLSGLTNRFCQIGPGHLEHPDCITEKSITVFLCTQDAGISRVVGHHGKRWHFGKYRGRGFVEDVNPAHLNERTPGLRPSWRRRLAPGCSPVWAFLGI